MTHGKPCVKVHVFTRHMASHVSTCMGFDLCINRGVHNQFVEGETMKGKKKKGKGEKKERKERKEKKERKRKEASGFFLSSLAFRQSELVEPKSKVRRFDEGLRFKR